MKQQPLNKKEYTRIHNILSEKRAVKELLESLKIQLAQTLVKEDKWWAKVSQKYELDTSTSAYRIDHAQQCILGLPLQQKANTPSNPQKGATPPLKVPQQSGPTMKVRQRQENNGVLSSDEIQNIERMRQEHENGI